MNIKLTFNEYAPELDRRGQYITGVEIDGKTITDPHILGWLAMRFSDYCNDVYLEQNPLRPQNQPKPKRRVVAGFVYVMKDSLRNTYKIGFSKKPDFREKTLQAEVPSIERIATYAGTMDDERELHRRFDNLRLRGEWFSLGESDLNLIAQYFAEKETEV